jgi:RNA polymerase sigma-70 factor, ECF subfamily
MIAVSRLGRREIRQARQPFGAPRAFTQVVGNPASDFDDYFRELFPRAVAVVQRVVGERQLAEDAAVEALARAFARWDRVAGLQWRDGWVLKVALREAVRMQRRSPETLRADAIGTHDEIDDLALRHSLAGALSGLPRRQREALGLRYLADLSEEEVAAALGISRGSVKTHLHRGVSSLRELISERRLDRGFA